jgi:hypothetical protein
MRSDRQLVATDGNGLGLFPPFSRSEDLPPVAIGRELHSQAGGE